jgi:DNA-binding IclR family transcriptional regulator
MKEVAVTGQQPAAPNGAPDSAAGAGEQVSLRNSSASLRRALTILNYLGDDAVPADGATLAELAQALGMNKSTVLRLVAPLCDFGLVQQDEARRYRLGPQTAYLGRAYEERLHIPNVAHPVLHRLMVASGETIHLAVVNGPWVIYIDKVESVQPVRMASRIGSRQPAYSTGCGKAYLAYDEVTLDGVIQAGLAGRTAQTLTTPAALRADLEATRTRGYSIDDVENEEDIRCVGAAVFDHQGKIAASLSISGLSSRVTRARVPELGQLAMQSADEVSGRLGAPQRCLLSTTSRAAQLTPQPKKEVSRLWRSRSQRLRRPGRRIRTSWPRRR